MKVPCIDDAKLAAILGEALGDVDQQALLDVVQDLLIAGFVADQQQTKAIVLHHFQRLARHVGFGIARPGDAELAQLLRQLFHAGRLSVSVSSSKKISFTCGKLSFTYFTSSTTCSIEREAIFVSADGLGPQAEGAARFAAAAGVPGNIRVHQIAAEIFGDVEIALIPDIYSR